MASIEKSPAGTWRVRFRDPTGRQRRKTFRLRADADRFARAIEHAKDTGQFVDPSLSRNRLRRVG